MSRRWDPLGELSREKQDRIWFRATVTEFARIETEKTRPYFPSYSHLNGRSVRIVEEDRAASVQFSESIIDPEDPRFGRRLVYFTDGSVNEHQKIGGAGVTFQRFPSSSYNWVDSRAAIGGIMDSNDAELVAIDIALRRAFRDIHEGFDDSVSQAEQFDTGNLPRVYIITDSMPVIRNLSTFVEWRSRQRRW